MIRPFGTVHPYPSPLKDERCRCPLRVGCHTGRIRVRSYPWVISLRYHSPTVRRIIYERVWSIHREVELHGWARSCSSTRGDHQRRGNVLEETLQASYPHIFMSSCPILMGH